MGEPRIVFLDIETIPNLQQALENWCDLSSNRPGTPPTMSASVNSICSFGYRLFGSNKAIGVNAWDFPGWEVDVNDDREICKVAFDVINGADAIVTFNGRKFDHKFIQTRLAINDMPLLDKKIAHIDLCQISKSNFFLLNNRLKTVAKYLLQDNKMGHDGWPLWVKTHGGVKRVRCKESEAKMGRYNLKDVDLMVPLFKELRSVITNIPNYNVHTVSVGQVVNNMCPKCGSTRLRSDGVRATATKTYRRYCCKDCGYRPRTDINDRNPR